MTTRVNDLAPPVLPVLVNFWWDENGPVEAYTYDGDSYPYLTPKPAYRYVMHTTFTNEPIDFFAILSPEQEEEGEGVTKNHPRVIAPAGVTIDEYLWDFGDGMFGYGPFVTHEYKTLEPDISVKLTVVDSRGLEWSRARPINLVPHARGFISSNFSGAPL